MARSDRGRPTVRTLALWRRWLRANRLLVDHLDRDLREKCGLTLEEYDVLVQIVEAPSGRRKMTELADALLLARSSCTRLVSRLESKGLVAREPDVDDRRVVWATVTRSGRARLRRAAVVHLRGVESSFARHVDHDSATALDALLSRILSEEPRA